MRYAILGPLQVRRGDEPVEISAGRQRAALIVLLLHRGEPVSVDRLVDALWGESPPAMANGSLHNTVSRLRKALGPDAIATEGTGYAVALKTGDLDVDEFAGLAEAGRDALAADDPERAARLLREALALWRGPPLADVAFEPWAQVDVARLEEERLAALEDRIEADLALGRHAAVAGELRALCGEHPLRERLRAQRMLALYRCGRQDEALRAYDETRRALVEAAGLEPGPELRRLQQRILEQDPDLDGPAPAAREAAAAAGGRPARRRRPVFLAAGLGAVAAAAIVFAVTSGGDEPSAPAAATLHGNTVAVLDAATGRVTRQVPVGRAPSALTAGPAAIWTINADDRTVSRIDARTHEVTTFGTAGLPADLAADDEALWVANGQTRRRDQALSAVPTSVSRINARSSAVEAQAVLPRGPGPVNNDSAQTLAADRGAVWAIGPDTAIARLDAEVGEVTHRVEGVRALALAAGAGRVVALTPDGVVAELSPATGRVLRRISIHARDPQAIAVTAEAIWVTDPYEGSLWRIESEPKVVERTIDVGRGGGPIAAGPDDVWVANPIAGTLTRVDPRTARVTRRVELGNAPRTVDLRGRELWVGVAGPAGDAVPAAREQGAPTSRATAEACGPLQTAGGEPPDHVVVSDFPLQSGRSVNAVPMAQAVELVLRERRFRAGRFRVGLRSCDDSTSQSVVFDDARCASNALAYARDRTIVGVVGPLNSGCAITQIPILNQAGLALVGPLTSYDGLTRRAPDTPAGGLEQLHPKSPRTFVRVYPRDTAHMAGAIRLARRLGVDRLFVLDDDSGYGPLMAQLAVGAARRLGLPLAGRAQWNPEAASYRRLARRVAASRADGVLLAGLIDTNGGEVARAIRRAVGPAVPIIGGEGFTPVSGFVDRAGLRTARSMHLLHGGTPLERLPPRGRAFAARFAATQPGGAVPVPAIYAAQATEVLLDAIARSDGSRASVVRELFATRVEDGLVGAFAFDRHGDSTLQNAFWVQPVRGGGGDAAESLEGARLGGVFRRP